MIEEQIKKALEEDTGLPVYFEIPENMPKRFYVLERIGGSRKNYLSKATMALQSYAESLYEAAKANEVGKDAFLALVRFPWIAGAHLNSDYNYTDTELKRYRYQAVFDISY